MSILYTICNICFCPMRYNMQNTYNTWEKMEPELAENTRTQAKKMSQESVSEIASQ